MDKQVQHIIPLPANLQPSLDPIQLRRLEKLGCFELAEQVFLRHRLLRPSLQLIEDETFEQLLVRDADFDRLVWWAMLHIPIFDQWNVLCATHVT